MNVKKDKPIEYEAKQFYQNKKVAHDYNEQFRSSLQPKNLRARILGWREEQSFLRMLRQVGTETKSVLDIASGTGRYVEILLKHGYQVGGTDISKDMLSFAHQQIGEHPDLLFLKQEDAEELSFPANQYDLVTCMRLYHRVPPKIRLRMLQEVKRVGKGQAILFFGMTTPWLQRRRALRAKIITTRNSNPHPVTQTQLADELCSVGMRIQDTAWVLPFFAEGLIALVAW